MKADSNLSHGLIFLSVVSVVLAIVGAFWRDLWLASTQWLLVAAVLAIYAIYAKLSVK